MINVVRGFFDLLLLKVQKKISIRTCSRDHLTLVKLLQLNLRIAQKYP